MSTDAPPSIVARPRGTSERPGPRPAWLSRAVLADAAVGATLIWWAVFLARGTGGREPHLLSYGCVLLALAVVAVRPWRRLPVAALVLGHAVGAAAYGVVLLAPTGSAGADDAASYVYAAELLLVLVAWSTTMQRQALLIVAVLGAGTYQFAGGWLAWWGRQESTVAFVGTIYNNNPAGITLAAGALGGAVLVARSGSDPLRLLGWFLAPLCMAATVFSTSRGSQIALSIGLVLLVLLGVVRSGQRAGGLRVLGLMVVGCGVAVFLSGPPFFSERQLFFAGTSERSESFVSNGVARLEFWRDAWDVFCRWPLSGAGFNSFGEATRISSDVGVGSGTAFAHNGFLQVLADGGLLLAVPFFAAVMAVVVVALRKLPGEARAGQWVQPGAVAILFVLFLHSGMDFDWAYPSVLALSAVVGAAALPVSRAQENQSTRRVLVLGGTMLGLLLLAAVGGWGGGLDLNATVAD